MPRKSREISESGIYHVIMRGTNKQEIFHEDSDHYKYLEILAKYKLHCKIIVFGWCLMGNHIHLLLKAEKDNLVSAMRRIGVSYAGYYNFKYNSTGHLFQDRFKSERVESDIYLLTVLNYIHRNPVMAGIVVDPSNYKWSSCKIYYGEEAAFHDLLDKRPVLSMFSNDFHRAVEAMKQYREADNSEGCLDISVRLRLTDEAARKEIFKILPASEIAFLKGRPKSERDCTIAKIKSIKGLSNRQTARILGVSATLVDRAK